MQIEVEMFDQPDLISVHQFSHCELLYIDSYLALLIDRTVDWFNL